MKTLITYYSYSGITKKVVDIFKTVLEKKGQVDIQRLVPEKEIKSFIGQCKAARMYERAPLKEKVNFDASHHDVIIIACPVWAFAPAPAVNTYLDNISGLAVKRAIVLLTSGSGLGVKNCFKYIRRVLENHGVTAVHEINIPNRSMDEKYIIEKLEKVLAK